jgi:hypothetical protein
MIHIADLRPSELKRLDERLSNPTYAIEFIEALVTFLKETPADGGADSDLIYTTAVKLTNAKAWNHIEISRLAKALVDVPPDAVTIFAQGLPSKIAQLLIYSLQQEQRSPDIYYFSPVDIEASTADLRQVKAGEVFKGVKVESGVVVGQHFPQGMEFRDPGGRWTWGVPIPPAGEPKPFSFLRRYRVKTD